MYDDLKVIEDRANAAEALINELHTEKLSYPEYLTLIETPTDVILLLDEVRRVRAENEDLQRELDSYSPDVE
jgi:hypothetical protein